MSFYIVLIIVLTLLGGSLPLWLGSWNENKLNVLLAFSASFLMGISFFHLLPEVYEHLEFKGGIYVLIGFLGQSILQKYTHGLEHGHVHDIDTVKNSYLWTVIIGMSFHALTEGIPLGFTEEWNMSLYIAILLHKIPEAMVVVAFLYTYFKEKRKAWYFLIVFSLLTPISTLISYYFSIHNFNEGLYYAILAVISGVFLQIATTIYFEISNNKHVVKTYKWVFILLGILLSLVSVNTH